MFAMGCNQASPVKSSRDTHKSVSLGKRHGVAVAPHFGAAQKAHAEKAEAAAEGVAFQHHAIHVTQADVAQSHRIEFDPVRRDHTVGGLHHAALGRGKVDVGAAGIVGADGDAGGAGVH